MRRGRRPVVVSRGRVDSIRSEDEWCLSRDVVALLLSHNEMISLDQEAPHARVAFTLTSDICKKSFHLIEALK